MEREINGDRNSSSRRSSERLFCRDLPGGGFVAIEVAADAQAAARQVRVVVERRCDRKRREGHRPPVIHEEEWSPERGIDELFRIASDNAAIARGILRLPHAD